MQVSCVEQFDSANRDFEKQEFKYIEVLLMTASPRLPSTTEIDDFAFHHSSPHSLRHSLSSPPPHLEPDNFLDDPANDHDVSQVLDENRRISGNSSIISSFPASIIQHASGDPATPTRHSRSPGARYGSIDDYARDLSPRTQRGYASGFRNPSSVKAMQMREEDADSVMSYYRRSNSRMSVRSHSSAHSTQTSPSKRQSRSNQTSPLKGSKLKKEFPLVLLHCTLLRPASSTIPITCDDDLYAALLPEEYQQQWSKLQDRLVDPEMKARGILISHPHDDYELLEERLLESLELQTPRVKDGHYLRRSTSGADSGFESATQTEDEGDHRTGNANCPDCGKCLHPSVDRDRLWEIKVFAANGLMRAGAWAAAWREMEKVDIEVSLAMPEDVRREVNARLEALKAAQEPVLSPPQGLGGSLDAREQEIYGSRPASSGREESQHVDRDDPPKRHDYHNDSGHMHQPEQLFPVPIPALGDRRNIIIVLLSVMILFYALTDAPKQQSNHWKTTSSANTSILATTTTITSTSIFTSILTETSTAQVMAETSVPVAPDLEDMILDDEMAHMYLDTGPKENTARESMIQEDL